jgi:hypothetical protein
MSVTQINDLSYDELIAQRNEIEKQLMVQRGKNGIMSVGGTHFKRERDVCKRSNYTLAKVLAEFIDNVIKLCCLINIKININNNGYISEIRVTDNKNNGFENIRKIGTDNPFNFTHMRDGQDDDNELSQNGRGMKGASVCVSDKMTCITKSNNIDIVKVVCDFQQMANTEDTNESFNPKIFNISEIEYKSEHKLDIGSTIILEKIDGKNIYGKTNEGDLISDISESISDMYSPIIKNNGVQININDTLVLPEKDYFEETECSLFTIHYNLYKIQTENNDDNEFEYIIQEIIPFEEVENFYIFNRETKKVNLIKKPKDKKKYGITPDPKITIEYFNCFSDSKACAKIKATSVLYHPDFNHENEKDNVKCPKGRARLTLSGRRYGNWNKEGNNGTSNYVDTDIELSSKKIANEIGLTWNKHISNEQKNDVSNALHEILSKIFSKLNSDTSTPSNKKLYNYAVKNGISVPKKRIPTDLRDSKPTPKPTPKIQYSSDDDSDGDSDPELRDYNRGHDFPDYRGGGLPKYTSEDDSDSDSDPQIEYKNTNIDTKEIVNEKNNNKNEDNNSEENVNTNSDNESDNSNSASSKTEDNIRLKIVEDETENNVKDNENIVEDETENNVKDNENIVEDDKDNNNEDDDKNNINPMVCISKVQGTSRTSMTITAGLECIKQIKENVNGVNYNKEIIEVICDYCERCAKDQIQFILNFNTFEANCNLLIEFINKKYKYSNEENERILCGSQLFELYKKCCYNNNSDDI